MDNRNNNLEISGIRKFLSVIKDVLDKSYAIEFGTTSKDWLNDNSSIVLYRGALFTTVKDAYESMSPLEKKRVNKCLMSCDNNSDFPYFSSNGAKTIPKYINNIVGGLDGSGHCLQSATSSLNMLYNGIVTFLQIGEKFIFNSENYTQLKDQQSNIKQSQESLLPSYNENESTKFSQINHSSAFENDNIVTKDTNAKYILKKNSGNIFFKNESKNNKTDKITLFNKMQFLKNKSHPAYLLAEAIHENNIEKIKLLLQTYKLSEIQKLDYQDGNFYPPLHIACEEGKLEIADLLIAKGIDVNLKAANGGMRTALTYAMENGHESIIQLLIDNQADVNLKDNFDRVPSDWRRIF